MYNKRVHIHYLVKDIEKQFEKIKRVISFSEIYLSKTLITAKNELFNIKIADTAFLPCRYIGRCDALYYDDSLGAELMEDYYFQMVNLNGIIKITGR